MTNEEFKILLKTMKALYPKEDFLKDEYAANLWYEALCDLSYNDLAKAVMLHVQSSDFLPTIHSLREQVVKLAPKEAESYMTEGEFFALVDRAVRNSLYHAEDEFNRLPPLVQRTIGSHEALAALGMVDEETFQTVTRGQLLASYRAVVKSYKEELKYSPQLQADIDRARQISMQTVKSAEHERSALTEQAALLIEQERNGVRDIPELADSRQEAFAEYVRGWLDDLREECDT